MMGAARRARFSQAPKSTVLALGPAIVWHVWRSDVEAVTHLSFRGVRPGLHTETTTGLTSQHVTHVFGPKGMVKTCTFLLVGGMFSLGQRAGRKLSTCKGAVAVPRAQVREIIRPALHAERLVAIRRRPVHMQIFSGKFLNNFASLRESVREPTQLLESLVLPSGRPCARSAGAARDWARDYRRHGMAKRRKAQGAQSPMGEASSGQGPSAQPDAKGAPEAPSAPPGADPGASLQGTIHALGSLCGQLNSLAAARAGRVGDSRDDAVTLMRQAAQHAARALLTLRAERERQES
jgi:hypothetical protein